MKNIQNVLFVCTGNSCRSIMAEAYMKKRAQEENITFEVKSAGTLGIDGMLPTQEALKVITEEDIDTAGYESKSLTEDLLEWADIIMVMEPSHLTRILAMAPEAEGKVHYLGEFNPKRNDVIIPDPIGRTIAFYKTAFHLIKQSIEGFIAWLKE